jgi:hypothetical protein
VIDARAFAEQGYVVARQLFDADEVAALCAHFMRLREAGDGRTIELTGYAVDPRTTE